MDVQRLSARPSRSPADAMRPIDYKRMVEADALTLAAEFMAEETGIIAEVVDGLSHPHHWSLMVIGGAAYPHLETIAPRVGGYVVIDPHAVVDSRSRALLVDRPLDAVHASDLPDGPAIWVFTFNVYPYLEAPLDSLLALASPGDIAVITSWADTIRAGVARSRYLDHVFGPDDRLADAADATAHTAALRDQITGLDIRARVEECRGAVVQATVVHLGEQSEAVGA